MGFGATGEQKSLFGMNPGASVSSFLGDVQAKDKSSLNPFDFNKGGP